MSVKAARYGIFYETTSVMINTALYSINMIHRLEPRAGPCRLVSGTSSDISRVI